ncbi:TIGR03016 family PEP-CTERM system-associated outer membrane protein [Roseateles chitinivorans]|uniref:TIGR03016 family PEP-CTERM system-associated outer membrane protein n=2 Tax=Roseateles chitinivorans TaxID=2917965 RepID=UPI003D67BD85
MTRANDLRRRPQSSGRALSAVWPDSPVRGACLAALGLAAALAQTPAAAQDDGTSAAGARKGIAFTPRVSVSETWTDNLALSPDNSRDRAFITTVSPGLTISSNTGAIRGSFDYTLDGILYTKSDRDARLQNQLSTRVTAELVQSALFVDVTGNISQQAVSAFGQQSPDGKLDSPNRTETRTLQVSPYWRGRLGSFAGFELRAMGQMRDSSEGGAGAASGSGNSKEGALSLNLFGPGGREINWGLSASTTRMHFEQTGIDYRTTSVIGSLNWVPDVDWSVGLTGGRERSDYFGRETTSVYGANLRWSPGPRTKFAAEWQHHSYGDSHNLTFEHRMAQFSVRANSSQSVSTGETPTQATNYQLLELQFGSLEPDPVKRDAFVRGLLAALGLDPNSFSGAGFLSNTASLQRRSDLSLIWTGPRMTVTLSGNDNNSRRLVNSPLDVGSGDLALTDRVRQRGATVSVGYRLTPLANANVSYSRQNSRGDGGVGGNDMRTLTANATYRLGPRTDAAFGLRQTKFDDTSLFATSYQEHAIYASLTQRF